jgi:putative transposase
MVSPALRRMWVAWVRDAYGVSERRAWQTGALWRSAVRYVSTRPTREPLRQRLREMAQVRVSWGYKRLHVLLRREGWTVNHTLVRRLYREEGLTQKRTGLRRRKSATMRVLRPQASAANERWAMDFIHDRLASGEAIRIFSVVDVFTRECVALVPQRRVRGDDVARCLSVAGATRGLPAVLQADTGSEFTSRAVDHWAYWNDVRLDFSGPGKPTDNAHIESFHNSVRRECLTQCYCIDLGDAERVLSEYRADYNDVRPHSSLANQSPAHFRARGDVSPALSQLQNV